LRRLGLALALAHSAVRVRVKPQKWPPALDAEPWLRREWTKLDAATGKMARDGAVRVAWG